MKAKLNFILLKKTAFHAEANPIKTKTPMYICLGINVLSTNEAALIKGNKIQNNL